MRILHAIHDFLPRHRAGSEIYAFELCRQLARTHHVQVLCAELDPGRAHGTLAWRLQDGLPVVELANNWAFASFEESYASPHLNRALEHVLRALGPDVLHVHNLLNLSFDLPALARARGIPTVATLHDYTLVCPSGGQRVHVAEQHVCRVIDPERCSRCFVQSPFHAQMAFARLPRRATARGPVAALLSTLRVRLPRLSRHLGQRLLSGAAPTPSPEAIRQRLRRAQGVFEAVDLFVAPSRALAAEFERLGLPAAKIRVSDYGFTPFTPRPSPGPEGCLRIGFVGTLVWHKGLHVLLDALRELPARRVELRVFGSLETFPDYVARLRELARGLPVQFMGGFEPADKPAVYGQMDVLVVPSLWPENSPLVIHEAIQAGVPVIGARMGGIPELVVDGHSGSLYDPFSASQLAGALRRLLDDPLALRRFAATLPAVKSIERDAAEWDAIYRELRPDLKT